MPAGAAVRGLDQPPGRDRQLRATLPRGRLPWGSRWLRPGDGGGPSRPHALPRSPPLAQRWPPAGAAPGEGLQPREAVHSLSLLWRTHVPARDCHVGLQKYCLNKQKGRKCRGERPICIVIRGKNNKWQKQPVPVRSCSLFLLKLKGHAPPAPGACSGNA